MIIAYICVYRYIGVYAYINTYIGVYAHTYTIIHQFMEIAHWKKEAY